MSTGEPLHTSRAEAAMGSPGATEPWAKKGPRCDKDLGGLSQQTPTAAHVPALSHIGFERRQLSDAGFVAFG